MRNILQLIVLACLLFLTSCSEIAPNDTPRLLEQFYQEAKIETIDKVVIRDGSTGYRKTITNLDQIEHLLSLIHDIQYNPQANQEGRSGWSYHITLFDGDNQFGFTLYQIENTYYDTVPDILPIVDNYYDKLDIIEE